MDGIPKSTGAHSANLAIPGLRHVRWPHMVSSEGFDDVYAHRVFPSMSSGCEPRTACTGRRKGDEVNEVQIWWREMDSIRFGARSDVRCPLAI